MAWRVAPTQRSRYPSRTRLAAQGVPPFCFLFLDPRAARVPGGTRRTRAYRPPHVPPHQPGETPDRMVKGFASRRQREKIGTLDRLAWNAPVSEAEVLTALVQQSLHASQLSDHGNPRAGMGTEFGEAWALADGSIPIPDL